ncbi:MAG: hypothetical protein QM648_04955 [Solirubrobacterales bacterium]
MEFDTQLLESEQFVVEIEADSLTFAIDGPTPRSDITDSVVTVNSSNQVIGVELELPLGEDAYSLRRILPSPLLGE